MEISVFSKDTTRNVVENTNGIVLDSILISATTEEDLESDSYILTSEFSTLDSDLVGTIEDKSILKVKLDYGYEYFVVKNIDYDEFDKTLNVTAIQITIEHMNNLWADNIRPTELTVKDAVQWIYERTEGKKEIDFISDITTSITGDYVRLNMQEILYNNTNGILTKKAKGEVQRRGYTVYIKNKIELHNDIEIRKGKNLTGFNEKNDCSSIVTRINPISYNAPITDIYVNSPNQSIYGLITKEIKYDNVRLSSDVQDTDENKDSYIICDNETSLRTKLIELATKEFTEKHIDEPQVEYDIKFEDLSKYEEYKNYKQLESCNCGDLVKVITNNLTLNARVIKRKYNVLKQEIEECTLSNIAKELKPKGLYESAISNANLLNNITDGSSIIAQKIKGYLDSKEVSIRASRKVATEQDYIVAISECLDKESPLYGGIMWGTGGIYLSTQRTADNKDWDWSTAITSKGITADVIDTGTLRAIEITNQDGSFYIDLRESNGLIFRNEGKKTIQINKNKMSFYNETGVEETGYIETIGSSKTVRLGHTKNGLLIIGYKNENEEFEPYIYFDSYQISYAGHYPIFITKKTFLNSDVAINTYNSLGFGTDREYNKIYYEHERITFNCKNGFVFNDGIGVNADMTVTGRFICTGEKNRAVNTKNYGTRLLNAYETAECYFGDIGEAVIREDGEVKIDMDNIFLETVNTKLPYQVFITKYGQGDCWVSERTETYFIIEGTPNLQVGYEIKAKQIDYTTNRLEEFKERRI